MDPDADGRTRPQDVPVLSHFRCPTEEQSGARLNVRAAGAGSAVDAPGGRSGTCEPRDNGPTLIPTICGPPMWTTAPEVRAGPRTELSCPIPLPALVNEACARCPCVSC